MSLSDTFRKIFGIPSPQKKREKTSLKFEALECREMLAITSLLSESYTDTISQAGSSATMYLELKSDDSNKWVTVGVNIDAAEGSNLDPSKIKVKFQQTDSEDKDKYTYEDLPEWTIFTESDGESSSMIIFTVPAGTYQITVGGDDKSTGAFTADVYVPGGTKDHPTSVEQYTPFLVQVALQQKNGPWNPTLEALYKKQLGALYSSEIEKDYPDLEVSRNGTLDVVDGQILGSVASSGKASASITKGEPVEGELKFSSASLNIDEKATKLDQSTSEITVSGGSSTKLSDYTVSLSSEYTISGGTGGADLSKVELPTLVSGTDYKFEDGKFYFNPNGKFDFIPKGTSATLTLKFTATDKNDTTLKGTGTITVVIKGMNDSPDLDKKDIDITPESSTAATEIWIAPWSETSEGETTNHSDEVVLEIDGNEIKIGSTVIATISDPDVGDTFQFATIGYPAGEVKFNNNVFTLYTSGEEQKIVGEIRLSSDGKKLTYKSAGENEDSLFAGLKDDEISAKLKFTFTVKDNRGISSSTSGGDEKSESPTVSVEFQVKGKTDPQFALSMSPTGTTQASIRAQSSTQVQNSKIPLTSFFALNYSDEEKEIYYAYRDISISSPLFESLEEAEIELIKEEIELGLVLSGTNKTDGQIEFDRDRLSEEVRNFLNGFGEDAEDYLEFSFKIRVGNLVESTEYVDSPVLKILFRKSTDLVLEDSKITVSQHDSQWTSSEEAAPISGGVEQVSPEFYEIEIDADYTVQYTNLVGEVYEKPTLVPEENYKFEVVLDEETGELGVVFSFNPDGKFDFLKEGQTATLRFAVKITDKINPALIASSTWEVEILGENAVPAPTFKSDGEISLKTDEKTELEIEADDVATSTHEDAELVFEKVSAKIEDVELVDGSVPSTSSAVDGFYVISRPESGTRTLLLKSGSMLILDSEGKITFDPTGRTESVDPEEGADEKFTVVVQDIGRESQPVSSASKELTVHISGEEDDPDVPAPTFEEEIESFEADEDSSITITTEGVASSTNADAELVFEKVKVKEDNIDSVDGDPDPVDGYYIISRPESGDPVKIRLKSGAIILLNSDGTIDFDPTARTGVLEPYDEDNENSYADEEFEVIVADISVSPGVESKTSRELTVRVKGVAPTPTPTFLDDEDIDLSVRENKTLKIEAEDVASSTNPHKNLVFGSLILDEEDVDSTDADIEAEDGVYTISRPESDEEPITITLVSGSKITFHPDGTLLFDPTGRTDEVGEESVEEKFSVIVEDINRPSRPVETANSKELSVKVLSVDTTPAPEYKEDAEIDLQVDEDSTLTIFAGDVAESENEDAELVFSELAVKTEYAESVDDDRDPVGPYYIIGRPQQGADPITVLLKSGSKITLDSEGKITFDPRGRTENLGEGQEEGEKFEIIVADISDPDNPVYSDPTKELTVYVKGVANEPSVPSFKENVEHSTGNRESYQIRAEDIASSENAQAELVISEISVAEDDVESLDGTAQDPVEGYFVISRPETEGESITVNLKSGSKITLYSEGFLDFDAIGREELSERDEESFYVKVEDISDPENPVATESSELITVEVYPSPVLKEDSSLETGEDSVLEITADSVADSLNADCELVFSEVRVYDSEQGESGDPRIIRRPQSGSDPASLTLQSGSKIFLNSEGKITFDPTGRTADLEEGENAEESFHVIVEDLNYSANVVSLEGELTVIVKGISEPVEDGLVVRGGPFVQNTYASIEEMPESIVISPQYWNDGVQLGSEYSFTGLEILSSSSEDGEFSEDRQGIFSVNSDGSILVNKEALTAFHHKIAAISGDYWYYQIRVSAERSGGAEGPLLATVPITVRFVQPPQVNAATTLDGTQIEEGDPWAFTKSGSHIVQMEIEVSDLNDYSRTSEEWFSLSDAISIVDWKYGNSFNDYYTKTQVENEMDLDSYLRELYDHVSALIAAKGTAFDYAFQDGDEDYTWTLEYSKEENTDLYDFITSGNELHLFSQILVLDNDFGGTTPIDFTIILS